MTTNLDVEAIRVSDTDNLTIDPELRDCLPDAAPEARNLLESLILARKFEAVVYVWNGLLWDGHTVKAICDKHGIPYRIVHIEASTKTDAIIHRMKHHLGRRNLTTVQRLEIVCRLEKRLLEEARANQHWGPGKKALDQPTQSFEKKHTNERIAELAGVSPTTAKRFRKVRSQGSPKVIADMQEGEITIGKAYNKVMDQEKTRKRQEMLRRNTTFINPAPGCWDNVILNEDNLIVLGRMAEEIPHSVDAFIFDPPWNVGRDYGQGLAADRLPYAQYMDELLRRFPLMAKCLKIGGKIAVIIEQTMAPKSEREKGADYVRPLDLDLIAGVRRLDCGLRLLDRFPYAKVTGRFRPVRIPDETQSCPMLHPNWGIVIVWAYQDFILPLPKGAIPDYTEEEYREWSITPWTIDCHDRDYTLHPGTTPANLIERLIKLYTARDATTRICDPYNGSGTTTRICQSLGRSFIGIERTPAYCCLAENAMKKAGAA